MKNLNIEKTAKTPKVAFDAESGILLIEGVSIPENTFEFYDSALNWLSEYSISPNAKTTLVLKLEYFNTATASFLLNFFKKIQELKNTEVALDWYYEDDDIEMEDVGNDYKSMLSIPVNLIPIETF